MQAVSRSCHLADQASSRSITVALHNSPIAGDESVAFEATYSGTTLDSIVTRTADVISVLHVSRGAGLDINALGDLIAGRMASIGGVEHLAPARDADVCPPPPSQDTSGGPPGIEQALLTVDDLPIGFVEHPPCGPRDEMATCGDAPTPESHVFVNFVRRLGWLQQHVQQYQDATEAFERANEAASNGRECEDEVDGVDRTLVFAPVDGSPFGSDVPVWRLTITQLGFRSSGEHVNSKTYYVGVALRAGETLTGIVVPDRYSYDASFGDPLDDHAIEELTPIIETARRRLEAIQPQLD
jgi:hypothetical protein